ncbi:MAG: SycD/LcrH family type III secretion system chaperone [Candidatus Competibacteraceae bacterium]|jgi:type III secretion system low calcium response chaperone LcrH/SycD|nr:SycD/LcrH family type III secretion system chaperone [Candidatus Competibacteraceae bacterium]MBK8964029.1 SycD/LcrH family type III secretion system chaperone [Candidatus Competibacteraceae bacterium]MBK9953527.1 SycD/LcrH family type III secretion system chaperone [Candidatus Competibacteraceae bacterium]
MAVTQKAEQAIGFGTEELGKVVDALLATGGTLGAIRGLDHQDFEAIYSVGYSLYNQGKYADAEHLFKFLCFYDHLEKKNWMGLGSSRQMCKDFDGAIQAYSYMALLDVANPYPPLHAGDCYLALGKLEEAESGFFAAVHWAGDKPEYKAARSRAEVLLQAVKTKREARHG